MPMTPEERRLKNREAVRRYKAAHPERVLASSRRSRAKNPAYYVAYRLAHRAERAAYNKTYNAAHFLEHRAEAAARSRAWAAAHRDREAARASRRRAWKRQSPLNDLTAPQWQAILEHYNFRCVYCPPTCATCKAKRHALTQDHIIPLSKGGLNTFSNVVPACRSCNSKKGARAPLVPVQPLLLMPV